MKYSLNKLNEIKQDITSFILSNESLDRNLTFLLRTNIQKIDQVTELVEEDFIRLSEDEKQQLQDFQQQKMEIIREHGGKIEQTPQGMQVTNFSELSKDGSFNEVIEELAAQFEETLNRIEEVEDHNNDIAGEKIAEINWREISINKYPEQLDKKFTTNFLEFTKIDD